jgi:GWxTD domain-containing protein
MKGDSMRFRGTIIAIACSLWFCGAARAGEAVSRGDFEFFLDAAAFRNPDGSTRQEMYVRLPSTGVRFKGSGGRYQARPRVAIVVRDAEGRVAVEDEKDMTLYADVEQQAEDPRNFHTLTARYNLTPGAYTVSCEITDLNSPKVTVLGMMRNEHHRSVITGYALEVPAFPAAEMSFSDARFLWEIGVAGDESTYRPNPSRLYGLYRDTLMVYVEAYIPRDVISTEGLAIRTKILDERGETVEGSSVSLQAVDPPPTGVAEEGPATRSLAIREDINRLPAGRYSLYVEGVLGDSLLVRAGSGNFSVAWDLRSWEVTRRSFIAEARFLLDEKEFAGYTSKTIGEQEAILEHMWKELDPDPATGVNEAYEKFMERLAYVNARFVDYQTGIFEDRGLIYLSYGPPDEKIVDVIPLNRETTSDAFEKVRDRFHPVNFSSTGGRLGYGKPQKDIIVDPRRLGAVGEGGETASPYELWIYDQSGDPIRKRDRNLEPDHGLRFIFVDREGYGRYKLESSSSMSNK